MCLNVRWRSGVAYNGSAVCVVPTIGGMIVIPLVMCGDFFIVRFVFAVAGRLFWQLWFCGVVLSG